MRIYLIGSLRNPEVPKVGNLLRSCGWNVFDDWHGAGPHADDEWQRYEREVGHSYAEALEGDAARNTFRFDYHNLIKSDAALLVMPAGRSGHLELGFMAGQGKKTYVLFEEEPERWDVMYRFCDKVFFNRDEMVKELAL